MSTLLVQVIAVVSDFIFIGFALYYFLKVRAKEEKLDEREGKADAQYHQVVDSALSRERKILEDATEEADEIIKDANYISGASKEAVNQALNAIAAQIQNETLTTAREFMKSYSESLKTLVNDSLSEFRTITNGLETDLQTQIKKFNETLLPSLEKELESYKESRMKQIEQKVTSIVRRASSEILNKSIPIEEHENLVVDSLERAKQQGVFE